MREEKQRARTERRAAKAAARAAKAASKADDADGSGDSGTDDDASGSDTDGSATPRRKPMLPGALESVDDTDAISDGAGCVDYCAPTQLSFAMISSRSLRVVRVVTVG